MPTTDCATDAAMPDAPGFDCQIEVPERAPQGTSRPLRGLFFGFAATVTVGLALASWYVGVRIVRADEVSAPVAASMSAVAETAAAPPPVTQAARDSIARAYRPTVPPPQFYLQIAGLGERRDATFVRSLQLKGFRAEVRMSQGEDERVLVGPFSTHAALERAQGKLESQGVLAVETDRY
jgi:SPOR domain